MFFKKNTLVMALILTHVSTVSSWAGRADSSSSSSQAETTNSSSQAETASSGTNTTPASVPSSSASPATQTGPSPNSSTMPPLPPYPYNIPDEYFQEEHAKEPELLKLLTSGGGIIGTAIGGTFMMLFQGVLMTKAKKYFNKENPSHYHEFFPSSPFEKAEAARLLDTTIDSFKKVKEDHTAFLLSAKSEKAGPLNFKTKKEQVEQIRIQKEQELLNKLERKVMEKNIQNFEQVKVKALAEHEEIQKLIKNHKLAKDSSPQDISDHEEKLKTLKEQRHLINEHAIHAINLSAYYSAVLEGKEDRQAHLLEKNKIEETVHEAKQQFAKTVKNTPAIYNNLSDGMKNRLKEQAERRSKSSEQRKHEEHVK